MTSPYTFLHAADLHIDSPLRGLERYEEAPVEEIRAATRRAFENLVAFARESGIEFLVLAGDVFDGDWKDYGTGLWFTARLRELTEAGIRVYLAAGNHDAQGKMTLSLRYPEGVVTFGSKRAETVVDEPTGAVLHGQSFAKAATTEDLSAGYPAPHPEALNIGVLHTALSGRPGHDNYAPCSPDALRNKGYDYWALGHVHQREVVEREPWIVFPGNLQARHARETGAKGATLVTVEDGRVTRVTEEIFDVVRFARISIDVGDCRRRSECEDRLEAALSHALDAAEARLLAARIEFVGRTEADAALRREREALVASCRDRANALGNVWVEKVKIETEPAVRSGGHDLIDTLELDQKELQTLALERAREDIEALLGKLPTGVNLAAEGLDLRDEETLTRLLAEAREEVVGRLLDADSENDE